MVANTCVFDTNILIDCLNGISEATRTVNQYEQRFISIVSWMEVLAGEKPDTEQSTREFLRRFVIVAIPPSIAERTIVLRQQSRLKLPDAVILATAEVLDCVLLTRNTRDFRPENPHVLVPYRLQ